VTKEYARNLLFAVLFVGAIFVVVATIVLNITLWSGLFARPDTIPLWFSMVVPAWTSLVIGLFFGLLVGRSLP
jgi:hypothetical protein